ncbi:MAG: saccharopine dehydrogenase family protein [Candidatus Obscuribacterales bacterium]
MAKIVVLGGAGAMGQITVRDLAVSATHHDVVVADLDEARARDLVKELGKKHLSATSVDLKDEKSLSGVLKGAGCIINSAPYYFNVQVMEASLKAGCHYIDLGGLYHVTFKQLELHDQFKNNNLLAVLGTGASPGTTNIMVAAAAREFDTISDIAIICAGVDNVVSDHPFEPPYMLDTMLDEYTMPAPVFENGAIVMKPPFSEQELIDFPEPIGRQSAMPTIHSEVATLPISYKEKGVSNVAFKLALPSDMHARLKFLVELGFGGKDRVKTGEGEFTPRKILAEMIARIPSEKRAADDVEILRVDVSGTRGRAETFVRMEAMARANPDMKVGGGDLNTGIPPSIIAQMIVDEKIKDRGVLAPELCVDPEHFFAELGKRGVVVRKTAQNQLAPTC